MPRLGKDWAVTTDDAGVFSVANLPALHRVDLEIHGEGFRPDIVSVECEDDDGQTLETNRELLPNDFVHTLRECFIVRLKGKRRSGAPVKIRSVAAEVSMTVSRNHQRWSWHRFDRAEVVMPLVPIQHHLGDGGVWLWVEPAESGLLGRCVRIPKVLDRGETVLDVEFREGIQIRGQVTDELDQSPIEGVHFGWISELGTPVTGDGDFKPLGAGTDRQGRYSTVVPDADGWFGVECGLPKHRSIGELAPVVNSIRQRRHHGRTRQLLERFVQEMQAGSELEQTLDFELQPMNDYRVQVVNSRDEPQPNAIVTGRVNGLTLRPPFWGSVKRQTWVADREGYIEIFDWYQDANLLFQGLEFQENLDRSSEIQHRSIHYYPQNIEGFSETGFLQGSRMLTLAEQPGQTLKLKLVLDVGRTVEGQLLDQHNQPLSGIEVVAKSGGEYFGGGQRWTTSTRNDGRFRLVGLPTRGLITLGMGSEQEWFCPAKHPLGRVETPGPPGELVVLDPVRCLDCRNLRDELPPLDLERLESQAAIEELKEYLELQFQRIPERTEEFFATGRDPGREFRSRVMSEVLPAVQTLVKRLPQREAGEVLDWMVMLEARRPERALAGDGERLMFAWVRQTLLRDYVNDADRQATLLTTIRLKYRGYIEAPDIDGWETLAAKTPFEATRSVARAEALDAHMFELVKYLGAANDRSFEQRLRGVKQAIENFDLESSREVPGVESVLKRLNFRIEYLQGKSAAPVQSSEELSTLHRQVIEKYQRRARQVLQILREAELAPDF